MQICRTKLIDAGPTYYHCCKKCTYFFREIKCLGGAREVGEDEKSIECNWYSYNTVDYKSEQAPWSASDFNEVLNGLTAISNRCALRGRLNSLKRINKANRLVWAMILTCRPQPGGVQRTWRHPQSKQQKSWDRILKGKLTGSLPVLSLWKSQNAYQAHEVCTT